MALLGKVFDEQPNVDAFIRLYQQRLELVRQRVATPKPEQRPSVFIERSAGIKANGAATPSAKAASGSSSIPPAQHYRQQAVFQTWAGESERRAGDQQQPDFYLLTAPTEPAGIAARWQCRWVTNI
ncbi:hypothetical protein M8494_27495 [Serratia ureilytica]